MGWSKSEEDISPDPWSQSLAESWRSGAAKELERQLARFAETLPAAHRKGTTPMPPSALPANSPAGRPGRLRRSLQRLRCLPRNVILDTCGM
jgi:hypothetical protein